MNSNWLRSLVMVAALAWSAPGFASSYYKGTVMEQSNGEYRVVISEMDGNIGVGDKVLGTYGTKKEARSAMKAEVKRLNNKSGFIDSDQPPCNQPDVYC